MRPEIDYLEVAGLQLPSIDTQPKIGAGTDIGEAEIFHTMFGRARVRITRKQDKIRRTWQLGITAALLLGAATWLGWYALDASEPQPVTPLVPAAQLETPSLAPAASAPIMAPPGAIEPVVSRNEGPQPASAVQSTAVTAKPIAPGPVIEGKPSVASKPMLPAANIVAKRQAPAPHPAASHPVALPAARPLAAGPVAAVPVAKPVAVAPAPTAPAADKVAPASSVQPQVGTQP